MSLICIASSRVFLGSKSYKLTLTWFNPDDEADHELWLVPARHDGSLCAALAANAYLTDGGNDEGMFYMHPSSGFNCLWF